LLKGAIVASAIAGFVISEGAGTVATAADSQHFKQGLKELGDGDLERGTQELIGPGDGVYSNSFCADLVDKGFPKAAILFEQEFRRLMTKADNTLSRPGIIPITKK
jgi:hypothetical protein